MIIRGKKVKLGSPMSTLQTRSPRNACREDKVTKNVETTNIQLATAFIENEHGINFCSRQALTAEKGKGNIIWDDQGREYLDFTSGWGVTCLGHSHPEITLAINKQAEKLLQNPNSGFTYSPVRAQLLVLLDSVTPKNLSNFYFANSGAEANDAALKLARKVTGRCKVVSTIDSFHGRTFNTLSVSGGPENIQRYLPVSGHTQFLQQGEIAAIKSIIDEETAAVIAEPIQGEGGVRIAGQKFLAALRKRCDETGALLIIDEIQTGFCRTGKFFALDHFDSSSPDEINADILTMGKGIAGGFPFAAFAITAQINKQIETGDHGGTYCGNPLGCAVAYRVISYLKEQNVAKHVAEVGSVLLKRLEDLQQRFPSLIHSARGQGLLCAIEFHAHDQSADALVASFTDRCLEQGLLLTPTRKGVVRYIPSLLTTLQEIDQALAISESVLKDMIKAKAV